MDQNPEEGIYILNFEAGHRTLKVKQWEMAQFIIGKSVNNFSRQTISRNQFISHQNRQDKTLYWVF